MESRISEILAVGVVPVAVIKPNATAEPFVVVPFLIISGKVSAPDEVVSEKMREKVLTAPPNPTPRLPLRTKYPLLIVFAALSMWKISMPRLFRKARKLARLSTFFIPSRVDDNEVNPMPNFPDES